MTTENATATGGADAPGRDPTTSDKRPARSILVDPIPWLALASAVGLDQLTKWLVTENLLRGESWPDSGFFRITHAWNTGTAFGLLEGQGGILTVVSFAAVIALYWVYRSVTDPSVIIRVAFGLLLGGAFGNLIDRIRLGHVTDFVDVGRWPIFNIADSSILVGIAVMFTYFWLTEDRKTREASQDGDTGGDAVRANTDDSERDRPSPAE